MRVPRHYIEPIEADTEELQDVPRVSPEVLPVEARKRSFAEVEMTICAEDACREAGRCLRCDLEFTAPKDAPADEESL